MNRPLDLLRPQMKLWKGNVFTSMCQGFCPRGGGGLYPSIHWADTPWADTSPGQSTLGRHIPLSRHPLPGQTPPMMATAADGTHPTGMHYCSLNRLSYQVDNWSIGRSRFISLGWCYSDWVHNKKVDTCTHYCTPLDPPVITKICARQVRKCREL